MIKKVRRHLGNRKAKEVFDLLQTNHDCNAVREADHNGDRNELDEAAELKEPHEEQYDARPNCRKHQIGDPVLSNDAVDDDDESTCRTACDDGRVEAGFRRYAGGNAEGHG